MKNNEQFQKEVDRQFSESVNYYHNETPLQKETADRLANALEPWLYSVPDGEILEVGCGTGFFTQHLMRLFPGRKKKITDLSDEMVQFCRSQFNDADHSEFEVLNADTADLPDQQYALICGNYVAQWFTDPALTLERLSKSLKIGGLMLMAFPGDDSYPEWRTFCRDLGIPYTGNPMPDTEQLVIHLSMGPFQVDFYEDQSREEHDSVYAFFRHLKKSGTSTPRYEKSLARKQLKLLNDYWLKKQGGSIEVTYHNVFLALKRMAE